MATTIVSNETQLAAWNGTSNLQINASFSITTATAASFPLAITAPFGITIQSNPSASTIYVISIDTSSSTTWNGLFSINTTNTVSISNLSFNCVSASLTEYNSLVLLASVTATYNPNVSFSQCSVIVGSDIAKITYASDKWGGFVGNLDSNLTGSTISFTDCTYQGYLANESGALISQGYSGGGTTYSCTITISQCFVKIIMPTGFTPGNSSAGLMGTQSRLHTISISYTIVNLNDLSTVDSGADFGGFLSGTSDGFTIANSYVIVTSATGNCYLEFICIGNNASLPSTVSNCYFVNQASGTNSFKLYNYRGGSGANMTLTNCAFQSGTTANSVNGASSNNVYSYTYTTNTASAPFTSWSGSIWSNLNTTTPPILTAFTTTPFINYTTSISTPLLYLVPAPPPVPCLCRGMKILTPSGDVRIESLKEGDLLLAPPVNNRTVEIQRIYSSTYVGTLENVPYRIPAHFFEKNIPNEDVLLSPHHLVFYNGKWHLPCQIDGLQPEEHMIGETFEYYHISLPDYYSDKVWCHNLPVDSWDQQETTLDILEQEAYNAASTTSISPCKEKATFSNTITNSNNSINSILH